VDIARLYLDAQRSFVSLCDGFSDAEWSAAVPCNPDWTVWDVLSHVAGVTDDIVNGRVEGAATDPWTAAQVGRWRETPRDDLIERWDRQVGDAAAAIAAVDEIRPPLDCHSHEHDVRHALGRPGNRDSELVRWMSVRFGDAPVGRAVEIEFEDGSTTVIEGADAPLRLRNISRFELVRSRLGRRSRAQVLAYDWSESPPAGLLSEWFLFGPSPLDIVE
jgi:hypothetical protein